MKIAVPSKLIDYSRTPVRNIGTGPALPTEEFGSWLDENVGEDYKLTWRVIPFGEEHPNAVQVYGRYYSFMVVFELEADDLQITLFKMTWL